MKWPVPGPTHTYSRGRVQYLFKALELGDGMYWVVSGTLDVLDHGVTRTLAVVTAGNVQGTIVTGTAADDDGGAGSGWVAGRQDQQHNQEARACSGAQQQELVSQQESHLGVAGGGTRLRRSLRCHRQNPATPCIGSWAC